MSQANKIYVAGHRGMVGSAIVRRIGEHGSAQNLPEKIIEFVKPIAEAIRNAT